MQASLIVLAIKNFKMSSKNFETLLIEFSSFMHEESRSFLIATKTERSTATSSRAS